MRLILVRDLKVAVTEASDGLEALELLSKHRFRLVVIDLDLPVIDGLRVIEILREAPDEAAVPVVVVSSKNDEATVRQSLHLNVGDFIVKPVSPVALSARLSRLLSRTRVIDADVPEPPPSDDWRALPSTVLVADGDPDFRHFMETALRGHARTIQAASGTEALRLCLTSTPDAALIGHNLGLLKSNVLVGELRRRPNLRRLRIVAVAPKNLVETVAASAVYDGVLARTYLPVLFLEQFRQIFAPPHAMARLVALYPALGASVVSAVEQVFGMMLGVEMQVVVDAPGPPPGHGVQTVVDIVAKAQGLSLRVELASSLGAAAQATARLLDIDAAQVTEANLREAMNELANIITGRLRTSLGERGIAVHCSLPASQTAWLEQPQGMGLDDGIRFFFQSPDRGIDIVVGIRGVTPTA